MSIVRRYEPPRSNCSLKMHRDWQYRLITSCLFKMPFYFFRLLGDPCLNFDKSKYNCHTPKILKALVKYHNKSKYNCHTLEIFKALVKYHTESFQNFSMTAKITARLLRSALPTLQPPTELQELDAYRSIGPRFPKTTTSQPPNSPRSTCATCSIQGGVAIGFGFFQKMVSFVV